MNSKQIKSKIGFWWEEKTRVPGDILSEQSGEPTNLTHIWRRVLESLPDHIDGKRVTDEVHLLNNTLFCGSTIMNMVNKAISEMNNLLIKRFGVISARYRGQEPCQIDRGGPSFLIVLFSLQLIFIALIICMWLQRLVVSHLYVLCECLSFKR